MNAPRSSAGVARGQPVFAIAAILGVWIALRLVFWQSPLAMEVETFTKSLEVFNTGTVAAQNNAPDADLPEVDSIAPPSPPPVMPRAFPTVAPDWQPVPLDSPILQPISADMSAPPQLSASAWATTGERPVPARRIVGHTMLLAAGLAQLPVPPLVEEYLQGRGPIATGPNVKGPGVSNRLPLQAAASFASAQRADAWQTGDSQPTAIGVPSRWTLDAWALWRDDTSAPIAAAQPSYGRSQVGAVLRYRLAPASRHRPQVHLRATSAIEGRQEREAALGLSARPVAGIPVRVAGEARFSDRAAGGETRAAAFAVSEFPPLDLPGGLRAEAYVQAGYVTGDFDTGFVDGQARVTGEVVSSDEFRLSAGGGAWGGAQQGASRIDIGPSATVSFRVGEGHGRLSADYRFRVAGEAAPASGPALTLSAGF